MPTSELAPRFFLTMDIGGLMNARVPNAAGGAQRWARRRHRDAGLFLSLVLVALVTTLMTSPIVAWLTSREDTSARTRPGTKSRVGTTELVID